MTQNSCDFGERVLSQKRERASRRVDAQPTQPEDNYFQDHYSRDWDLLEAIGKEFEIAQATFELTSEPHGKTLRRVLEDEILRTEERRLQFKSLLRLYVLLSRDSILAGYLRSLFYNRDKFGMSRRRGCTFEEIAPIVFERIYFTIWRSAAKWCGRKGTDQHWAQFWNEKNLCTELSRACESKFNENQSVSLSEDVLRSFPLKFPRTPEKVSALLDVYCGHDSPKGADRFNDVERAAFTQWYLRTGAGDDDESSELEIASTHFGVEPIQATMMLNALIERAVRNSNRKPLRRRRTK